MKVSAGRSARVSFGTACATGAAYDAQSDGVVALPEHDAYAVVRDLFNLAELSALVDLGDGPEATGDGSLVPRLRRALVTALGGPTNGEPLALAIDAVNRDYFAAVDGGQLAGDGGIVAAARLIERHVVVAHVGDCRVYRVRDGRAARLTSTHGMIEWAFLHGTPYAELTELAEQGNVIVRAVGMTEHADIDVRYAPAEEGDVIVLATAGCAEALTDAQIAALVDEAAGDPEKAARALAQAACAVSDENICVLVLRLVVAQP